MLLSEVFHRFLLEIEFLYVYDLLRVFIMSRFWIFVGILMHHWDNHKFHKLSSLVRKQKQTSIVSKTIISLHLLKLKFVCLFLFSSFSMMNYAIRFLCAKPMLDSYHNPNRSCFIVFYHILYSCSIAEIILLILYLCSWVK